jgi:iron complex outermembrane receptor protein
MHTSGANLLARWSREIAARSEVRVQAYVDRTRRDIPNTYKEIRNTLDVEAQHGFPVGERHEFLWGAGYRVTSDRIENTTFAAFEPDRRSESTLSAFIQDRIELWDDKLFLTLGSKFEFNGYSRFEIQPSARIAWHVSEQQTAWAAVSRAVRTPSRLDSDLRLTVPFAVPGIPFPVYVAADGSADFEAEELTAYEAGYRLVVGDALSFDLSVFYNDYDNLQTLEAQGVEINLTPPAHAIIRSRLSNGMRGESYGGTLVANWRPTERWRLQFQYTRFDLALHRKPGSVDANSQGIEGNSPQDQFAVHSYLDLPYDLSLYTGLRYVDRLPNQGISSYTALDASLRWRATKSVELALTGRNLNQDRHPEFGIAGVEVERSVFGTVTWRY